MERRRRLAADATTLPAPYRSTVPGGVTHLQHLFLTAKTIRNFYQLPARVGCQHTMSNSLGARSSGMTAAPAKFGSRLPDFGMVWALGCARAPLRGIALRPDRSRVNFVGALPLQLRRLVRLASFVLRAAIIVKPASAAGGPTALLEVDVQQINTHKTSGRIISSDSRCHLTSDDLFRISPLPGVFTRWPETLCQTSLTRGCHPRIGHANTDIFQLMTRYCARYLSALQSDVNLTPNEPVPRTASHSRF